MTDKVALVTGASGGIGAAIVKSLKNEGYRLSLLSRSIPLQETENLLAIHCDVTKIEEVERAVKKTIDKFSKIDALINCAGRSHLGTVEQISIQDIETVFNVNVLGTVNTSKAVLPFMKKQGEGYIINIGSMRGITSSRGKAVYSMSKAAVIAFSKILGKEVEDYGIKVTVINPGFVQTELIKIRIAEEKLTPDDLTQPKDIATAVLSLLELSHGATVEELNIGRLW
jgi:short-subunit dehydrogenase